MSHDRLPSPLLSCVLWNSALGKWPSQRGLPLSQQWFHVDSCVFHSPKTNCRSSILAGTTKRTRAFFPHLTPTQSRSSTPGRAGQESWVFNGPLPAPSQSRDSTPEQGRYHLTLQCPLLEQEFHSRLPSTSLALLQ